MWRTQSGDVTYFGGVGPLSRGRRPRRPLRTLITHKQPGEGARRGSGEPPHKIFKGEEASGLLHESDLSQRSRWLALFE
jgi:hypothetical protein